MWYHDTTRPGYNIWTMVYRGSGGFWPNCHLSWLLSWHLWTWWAGTQQPVIPLSRWTVTQFLMSLILENINLLIRDHLFLKIYAPSVAQPVSESDSFISRMKPFQNFQQTLNLLFELNVCLIFKIFNRINGQVNQNK